MELTLSEVEILKAIDKSGPDEGEYTSFKRMIDGIGEPALKRDGGRIRDALASLETKTFIETTSDDTVKLTEGGLVALRAL